MRERAYFSYWLAKPSENGISIFVIFLYFQSLRNTTGSIFQGGHITYDIYKLDSTRGEEKRQLIHYSQRSLLTHFDSYSKVI